jgi:hypothetical protein
VKLGNDGDTDENKKLVACAMANLTGVSESMIRHVVMNGAAKCLVTLCAIVDHFDEVDTIDIRVAAGLANLTVHTSSVLKLISSDVHLSLMMLAKDEGAPTLREAFDLVDADGQGTCPTPTLPPSHPPILTLLSVQAPSTQRSSAAACLTWAWT